MESKRRISVIDWFSEVLNEIFKLTEICKEFIRQDVMKDNIFELWVNKSFGFNLDPLFSFHFMNFNFSTSNLLLYITIYQLQKLKRLSRDPFVALYSSPAFVPHRPPAASFCLFSLFSISIKNTLKIFQFLYQNKKRKEKIYPKIR